MSTYIVRLAIQVNNVMLLTPFDVISAVSSELCAQQMAAQMWVLDHLNRLSDLQALIFYSSCAIHHKTMPFRCAGFIHVEICWKWISSFHAPVDLGVSGSDSLQCKYWALLSMGVLQ